MPLPHSCTRNARAREGTRFHGYFLLSDNFLLQHSAILRNAARISFPPASSEKHAAQHPEKLRKKPSLNYESPALTAELQARYALARERPRSNVQRSTSNAELGRRVSPRSKREPLQHQCGTVNRTFLFEMIRNLPVLPSKLAVNLWLASLPSPRKTSFCSSNSTPGFTHRTGLTYSFLTSPWASTLNS
jgi:hypothetical protein